MSKVSQPRRLSKKSKDLAKTVKRILDANLNRALEGLRVCEEFCRFVAEERSLTSRIKSLRHALVESIKGCDLDTAELSKARDIVSDVGKETIFTERRRRNLKHIILSNLQRVKESLRVLEEYLKINFDTENIKKIRYQFYEVEKKIIERL